MSCVRLLLVEDDTADQLAFQRFVAEEHLPFVCTLVASLAEARAALRREAFDVVVADYRLGDGDAFDLLALRPAPQVIITTGAGSEHTAARAIKAGAHDYLVKDLDRNYLKLLPVAVERVVRGRLADKPSTETSLFGGASLRGTLELIELAARSDSPVFITGETGTGKNLTARAIHNRSGLRAAPFVSINCAALPEHLIEGELFGHEKGAYTGAVVAQKGIFELASGGTLLLDELGEMPTHLQSKLLGVLDDKRVRRLGGETVRQVEVRLISATSIDLEQALGSRFRSDLYYRLSVIRIALPPLRACPADIPPLCRHVLRALNNGVDVDIADAELQRLCDYPWPGNVRELKNILERALILHRGGALRPSELLGKVDGVTPVPRANHGETIVPLVTVEREHIGRALAHFGGNLTQSARALGISISTLKRKCREYALQRRPTHPE